MQDETPEARLVHIGDPRIRTAAKSSGDFNQSGAVADDLAEVLRAIRGAGLAANQLGYPDNVAVVEVHQTERFPDRPITPLIVMIDPVELERSDDLIEDWEGCFSVPDYLGLVPRSRTIRVRYTDRGGREQDVVFEGYVARVVQHELDHLAGRVYLDRMPSMEHFTTGDNWLQFARPGEDTSEA
jgi:peptide deformylase